MPVERLDDQPPLADLWAVFLLLGESCWLKFGSQGKPSGTTHGVKKGHFKRSFDELDARGAGRRPAPIGRPVSSIAASWWIELTKYFGSQGKSGSTVHGTKMGGHFKRSVEEVEDILQREMLEYDELD